MKGYILNRLLTLIPTLLIVATVGFLLIHLAPGDPVALMLGEEADLRDVELLTRQLGLDQPILVQLVRWYGRLFRGDLGYSLFLHRPVLTAIMDRLECTLLLTLYALLISVVLGVILGIIAAVKQNTTIDQAAMLVSLVGLSMPSFWLGLMLIWLLALGVRWFPSSGYVPLAEGVVANLRSLFLPSLTLGFIGAAPIARMVRSSMLEVLNLEYIRTARAKGLKERSVILSHAFRNALIPAVTMVGMTVGGLIAGAIIVETVFALPGVGRLVISSIARRDFPAIQGVLIFTATVFVVVNLVVDILYVYLDPRVKYL
ncbi:MAG TPA: peptide ABC transporter [Clostridiales bacterium UBA8153]|nr:peptide ABC transporter [Clostridiales bacterium UBA8153]